MINNKILLISLILIIIIYLPTFPVFYASGDEYSYVRASSLLLDGTFIEDNLLNLELIFESTSPHYLKIYRWEE